MTGDAEAAPVPPAPRTALETGLVVAVPEVEPVLRAHRRALDPRAAQGVPPHVTVLYPFAPLAEVDDALLAAVRQLAARVEAAPFRLVGTSWFGDEVLWLRPEPEELFRDLTARCTRAFPRWPPYGGQYPDPQPHLTVAAGAPPGAMRAAAAELQEHLPLTGRAAGLTLMLEQPSGNWEQGAFFPFAGSAR